MIDAILYVPNFPALVAELDEHHPDMLQRDESGGIVMPPVVTGLINASRATRGDAALFYARLKAASAAIFHTLSSVSVLAAAEYTGKGTAERVYQQVFDSPDALAKYESVWQRTRTVTDPDTGDTREVRQDKFGHPAEESRSWYVPPVPLAEQLANRRADKLREINAAYQAELDAILHDYPSAETKTWDKQEAEARAWNADNTAPTPLLDAVAAGRNMGKAELVQRVLAKADAWIALSGQATGKRQRLEDEISNAATLDALDAIEW